MNRPSHYLLLCLLVFVGFLLASGRLPVARAALHKQGPEVVAAKEPHASRPKPSTVVEGVVLDALGFRMVGAEVGVRGCSERARTDADGQFRFELESQGPLWLQASANGFGTLQREVHPAAGDLVVFALEPQAPWDAVVPVPPVPPVAAPADFAGEGFVRDSNGKAVAGALVVVAESGACSRTDEIGSYRVPLPAAGATTLVVHDPDGENGAGRSARSEPQEFSRRRGLTPLPELVAMRGTAIRGTLRDGNGRPLAGVPLVLRGQGLQRSFLSGTDGAFRIAGLLAGSYRLLACAFRGAVAAVHDIDVTAPVVDCDLRLEATAPRHLRVVDENGKPVPRAFVATTFLGSRRAVGQADQAGAVDLPAAQQSPAEYEVRSAVDHRELKVRKVDQGGVLVVAAP
jgi:hypothetical protein